jgi:hypothetical protein
VERFTHGARRTSGHHIALSATLGIVALGPICRQRIHLRVVLAYGSESHSDIAWIVGDALQRPRQGRELTRAAILWYSSMAQDPPQGRQMHHHGFPFPSGHFDDDPGISREMRIGDLTELS